MGLYQRRGSRFWWMTYTVQEERRFESTKTTSKEIANKIWKRREGELALGLFKIGWAVRHRARHRSPASTQIENSPQPLIPSLRHPTASPAANRN